MLWVDVSLTMRVQIALGLVAALVFAPIVVAKGNAHHWETSPHHLSALVGTTYTKKCGCCWISNWYVVLNHLPCCPTTAPCPLEIKATEPTSNVNHFANEVQAFDIFRHHGF